MQGATTTCEALSLFLRLPMNQHARASTPGSMQRLTDTEKHQTCLACNRGANRIRFRCPSCMPQAEAEERTSTSRGCNATTTQRETHGTR